MTDKTIDASRFESECLPVIEEMARDNEPVTITNQGKPVAVLTPVKEPIKEPRRSLFGAMAGSVLRYDDPFEPACDPSDWHANR
jgi:prevent-host-death family protein